MRRNPTCAGQTQTRRRTAGIYFILLQITKRFCCTYLGFIKEICYRLRHFCPYMSNSSQNHVFAEIEIKTTATASRTTTKFMPKNGRFPFCMDDGTKHCFHSLAPVRSLLVKMIVVILLNVACFSQDVKFIFYLWIFCCSPPAPHLLV